jgi:hypothetical protein
MDFVDFGFEHRRSFLRSRKGEKQAEAIVRFFERYIPYVLGGVIGALIVRVMWAAEPPVEGEVYKQALMLANMWVK